MVTLDNLLGHGKTHAQAARFTGTASIGAPKTTKDTRQILFGNANTGIRHRDRQMLSIEAHGHDHPAPFGRVAHGVTHEVNHALRDHIGINLDKGHLALRLVRKSQAKVALVEQGLLRVDDPTH